MYDKWRKGLPGCHNAPMYTLPMYLLIHTFIVLKNIFYDPQKLGNECIQVQCYGQSKASRNVQAKSCLYNGFTNSCHIFI